jgi:hypothetical protein
MLIVTTSHVLGRTALRAGLTTLLVFGSLVVVAVPPAAAVIVTMPCAGTCGYWQVEDKVNKAGANCVYIKKVGREPELTKITVKPPEMNGRYNVSSTVGWRFIIQSNDGSTWSDAYTSPYQNAQANLMTAARLRFGFSRRGWSGPFDLHLFAYRVLVDMRWQQNGSTEGQVEVRYKWYLPLTGSNLITALYKCDSSYAG